jgi:thiamine pyrophosphokinase
MKRAIIIANGRIEAPPHIRSDIKTSSLVIAADGGIRNCKFFGIKPQVIVGDLDSMDKGEVAAQKSAGVEIIQYPTKKNETDLELALQYITRVNVNEVLILGGLGARWDMTLANLLLVANPMFNKLLVRFLDGNQEIIPLKTGIQSTIHGMPGDTVSLIPIAGDAKGITIQGLEYPLSDETLKIGSSRGVSNVFLEKEAKIYYREGLLLCILTKNS